MGDIIPPSKFSVGLSASDEEVLDKILETLNPTDKLDVDRSACLIEEPYLGSKEITIRRSDKSIIAFASLSEIHSNDIEWAVYTEV